jgi:hypothetical protein
MIAPSPPALATQWRAVVLDDRERPDRAPVGPLALKRPGPTVEAPAADRAILAGAHHQRRAVVLCVGLSVSARIGPWAHRARWRR